MVAIPHLAFLAATDDSAAKQAATDLSRVMLVWALPLGVGGALAAAPIIGVIYGAGFEPAVAPFRILIWSVITVYGNAAFAFLLIARGGDRRYLLAVVAGAIANVGLNIVIIPRAGMIGAAYVTIVSELTVLGILGWWTRDVFRAALPNAIKVAGIPTLAMVLIVWPVHDSLVAIPFGVITYGLAATLTGAIPSRLLLEQLRALRRT
jgi:O-antigen/teichoic acid export membrane protein